MSNLPDDSAAGASSGTPAGSMMRELTFGEKAVGLTFNPGGNVEVNTIKEAFANVIDVLHTLREKAGPGEKGRMFSVAITEAQTAQMWAVKAATWPY